MQRARVFALLLMCLPIVVFTAACVMGESGLPGCQSDAECEAGSVCRGNACFRIISGGEPPAPDGSVESGDTD